MVTEKDIGKEVYFFSTSSKGIKKGILICKFSYIQWFDATYFEIKTKTNVRFIAREDEIFTSKRQVIRNFLYEIQQDIKINKEEIKNYIDLSFSEKACILNTKPIYMLNDDNQIRYGVILTTNELRIRHIYKILQDENINDDIAIPCFLFYDFLYHQKTRIDKNGVKIFSTREDLIKEISRNVKEL